MKTKTIIECIKEEAKAIVEKSGYGTPDYVPKAKFETLTFELLDPITGESEKTYTYTREEYISLGLKVRNNLNKLKSSTVQDEEGYIKAVKEQEKIKQKWFKMVDKEYKNLIENKYQLEDEQIEVIASIIDTVKWNYTIDDEEDIFEVDFKIIDQIKKLG